MECKQKLNGKITSLINSQIKKRNAWKSREGISKDDAKLGYINYLKKLKPDLKIDTVEDIIETEKNTKDSLVSY